MEALIKLSVIFVPNSQIVKYETRIHFFTAYPALQERNRIQNVSYSGRCPTNCVAYGYQSARDDGKKENYKSSGNI